MMCLIGHKVKTLLHGACPICGSIVFDWTTQKEFVEDPIQKVKVEDRKLKPNRAAMYDL